MELSRDSLIQKIDHLVSSLSEHNTGTSTVQLQIEAVIKGDNANLCGNEGKYILGTLDLKRKTSYIPSSDAGLRPQRQSEPTRAVSGDEPDAILPTPPRTCPSPIDRQSAVEEGRPRRKIVGGLRLGNEGITPPRTPSPNARQIAPDQRTFPKRRRIDADCTAKLQPSTVDKLIEGIWEQIHKSDLLVSGQNLAELVRSLQSENLSRSSDFADVSRQCRLVTGASRTARSMEVMMQAFWVDCYEAQIKTLAEQHPILRSHQCKKIAMNEACVSFEWSEKELRNRMSIWKGYREIKDAAGWAALVFAGPGIYRFCKYRLGFDQEAISKLRGLRPRLEVAADTLQPQWRETLALVGLSTRHVYRGHPHDWVVSKRNDPVPLSWTYRQWNPQFSFQHISESVVDEDKWGTYDPRRVENGPEFTCAACSRPQSTDVAKNECECFSDLFGPNPKSSCPVQIFSTEDGRNNGLLACCAFERGVAVGEFLGLVTKGLENVDVMQSHGLPGIHYQISQTHMGNYTRFINHSCQPNCQFQTFVWLGIQRIIVVSKGVVAGKELTVDYSGQYWQKLDKICLCGESRCRYRQR